MKTIIYYIFFAVLLVMPIQVGAQTMLPKGESVFRYDGYAPFSNRPVDVHYYIPFSGDCSNMPIIFVFQGGDRGYRYLLDAWMKEAEAKRFMVFIPQFDLDSYPVCDYQEVGIMDKKHQQLIEPEATTPPLIDKIFEFVKQHTLTKRNTYRIYGHSAGGQFVHRFMLFHDSPYVDRAVIGSPGWYTFPDSTQNFPYGVKNVPYITKERIRSYFSKDIILQLAAGDTIRESFLRKTPQAEAQGRNRVERGECFYQFAQTLSHHEGMPFRWRKVIVDGVGHQSVESGMAAIPLLLEPSSAEYKTPSVSCVGEEFATMKQFMSFYESLQKSHSDQMRIESIGKTPEGDDIPIIYLGNKDACSLRVWIQGGLHGNEPAGPEVVAFLTKYLLETVEGNSILKQLNIVMVPVANPTGYMRMERLSGSGYDLNRDMTKVADPVTVLLKKAYLSYYPHVALDIHEYNPIKKELLQINSHQLSIIQDVLFLPSGHLNIPLSLRQITHQKLLPNMCSVADKMGYTHSFYFTPKEIDGKLYALKDAKSPQSSSTWNGLSNAVSFFIEIKGIGLGKTLFEKRVDCGFTLAKSLLSYVVANSKEIEDSVQKARDEARNGQGDVHVLMKTVVSDRKFKFWDNTVGKVVEVSLPVQDALCMEDEIVRKRPLAYILGPENEKAVEILRTLGVKIQQLSKAQTIDVEGYEICSYSVSKKKWEKIHPVTVTVKTKKESKRFPASTYIFPTNQEQSNLLVTLLEPESNNGFVNFGVIPLDATSKTVPIFRVNLFPREGIFAATRGK